MLRRHYSGEQRRALNMIWNAAGRYDIDPPFMAFNTDGSADFYMNNVIGLVCKWLDMQKISRFFDSYGESARADRFDEICWLGLENCVYEKEQQQRPILEKLRKAHADVFFRNMQTLSRQEMMTQNARVFEQQEARWAFVSGRKLPVLTPAAKSLYQALQLPGSLSTDEVIDHLQDILIRYFRFSDFSLNGVKNGTPVSSVFGNLLRKVLHREVKHVDSAVVRMGFSGDSQPDKDVHSASLKEKHDSLQSDEDRDYIEACFGRNIYNDQDMHLLENELCTGPHSLCRLWFTKGEPSDAQSRFEDARRAARQAQEQKEKNLEYFNKSSAMIASGIRRLSAQIETIIQSYAQPLPETSRAGRLNASRAWRMKAVNDPYVFTRPGDQIENDLSVDLLLDASASRLGSQSVIAAQAYIITSSLQKCGIPVQVSAFRSLRGYTVFQILKDYKEKDVRKLSAYYAAGWNRDGLALRAAATQMRRQNVNNAVYGSENTGRILIILTDAHPDDSTKMPPDDGSPFMREYDGYAALMDTAQTVQQLRREGVHVAAVYLGTNTYMENVHTIYGKEFVRIQKIEQLAAGVSELLQMILREMKN